MMSSNWSLSTVVERAYQRAGIPLDQRDPELVAMIRQRIADLSEEMTPAEQPGQTYLERLGTLRAVRQQASELVLADLLPRPSETTPTSSWEEIDPVVPPTWPTDPDHQLNDDDFVETLTKDEIANLIAEWEASPEQVAIRAAHSSWTSSRAHT